MDHFALYKDVEVNKHSENEVQISEDETLYDDTAEVSHTLQSNATASKLWPAPPIEWTTILIPYNLLQFLTILNNLKYFVTI